MLGDKEPDDEMHNPQGVFNRATEKLSGCLWSHHGGETDKDLKNGFSISMRGIINLGCLIILFCGILMLLSVPLVFVQVSKELTKAIHSAGYPILSHFRKMNQISALGGFGLGGINATGQIPEMPGLSPSPVCIPLADIECNPS